MSFAAQVGSLEAAKLIFQEYVTLRYQNSERLQGTIEERHGLTGTTLNVPISDQIEMQQDNFAPTDIEVTPVEETNVTIQTKNWQLKTVIGGGEKTLFAYDKIVDHVNLHSKAIGRNLDFIKLDAIFSSPQFGNIEQVLVNVGANTGINQGKMSEGLSYLESQGLDINMEMYDISMWAPALLKKSMQNDDRIVNFFYNDVKPLTNNRIQAYLDVDCRFVGENGVNAIPKTDIGGGIFQYLVPMVFKESIIQTFNRDPKTTITFEENQDRYELVSVLTSNSGIIQSNGIVLLQANNPFS